ncbi:MAG: hypothetical protein DDT22_01341 [candidate division WS2 bacterium]|nr:hypothetical protein [Candidatus Lithacetigena glycinireducens]
MLFLGDVLDLASLSKFMEAKDLLKLIEKANLPEELRFIINRYIKLGEDLFTLLEDSENLLKKAETYLTNYQTKEALEALNEAQSYLNQAKILIRNIQGTTNDLSNRVGALAAMIGTPLREAHDQLIILIDKINYLWEKLHQLLLSFIQRHEEIADVILTPTELILNVSPLTSFVGEPLTLNGQLTAQEKPLSGRSITVQMGDEKHTLTTNLDGSFSTVLTLPYLYQPTITMFAQYQPEDNDLGVYESSQSKTITVNLLYYTTTIKVQVPNQIYPAKSFTVKGSILSSNSKVERTLELLWNETKISTMDTQDIFDITLTAPINTAKGLQNLTLKVLPFRRYAGAVQKVTTSLIQAPLKIDITISEFILIPQSLKLTGRWYSPNFSPPKNSFVEFTIGTFSAKTRTGLDGKFQATLNIPFNIHAFGPQKLQIKIRPLEPWFSPATTTRNIFFINIFSLGLFILAVSPMGLLVSRKIRFKISESKKSYAPSTTTIPAVEEETLNETLDETLAETRAEIVSPLYPKTRIIKIYQQTLKILETEEQIFIAPHLTLREILNMVLSKLPQTQSSFEELTFLTELALYSNKEITEEMANYAENLEGQILEAIRSTINPSLKRSDNL